MVSRFSTGVVYMLNYEFKQLNKDNIEDLMILERHSFSEGLGESEDSFLQSAEVYPKGSLLLYIDNEIAGSIFFHPYLLGEIQEIKSCVSKLTGKENCMYLHSFSIHPQFRGKGLAHILFDYFEKISKEEGYDVQALVAVQNSERFWKKYGFEPVRQISYGNAPAVYMTRKTISC